MWSLSADGPQYGNLQGVKEEKTMPELSKCWTLIVPLSDIVYVLVATTSFRTTVGFLPHKV